MSRENVELIRRGYELFAQGRLDEVATLFSLDADLADAGGLGIAGTAAGRRFGPAGFLEATRDTAEAFDDYRVEGGGLHRGRRVGRRAGANLGPRT